MHLGTPQHRHKIVRKVYSARMNLRTLGGLGLTGTRFTQPKPLLLLAYLVLEGPQTRAHLAELFWPQGERRKSLSMALSRLHSAVGEAIQADTHRVRATVDSDVKALLGSLDRRDWSGADRLYVGSFLESAPLGDLGTELSEWVYSTREYLAGRVQYALLELAEEAAKTGTFGEAGGLAERAYRLPGPGGTEVVALGRLYALLCAGSSALAPNVRKEAEEYGVTLSLTTAAARAGFKLERTASPPLPMRGTSFVGRDEELTELGTLLAQPQVALVTLLGPAGVGKTRLALQLAHEQERLGAFEGGIYFMPLDALSDARLFAPSLLGHSGLSQRQGAEPLNQLADVIAERRAFFVLDNFEHLVESRSVLSHLLSRCPNLKLLVTSRERLRLEEEHVFPLGGLPYADAEADAVQLFRDRAQQVAPHFDLKASLPDVLTVCELVGGSPLGIELAAGWAKLLSPADIAEEIGRDLEFLSTTTHNVPERHRSLRAAFEASWRLLRPKEQGVLSKLSVFRGGFRREAAVAVAGATIPLLGSLVDKSLLRVLPNGRFERHPLLYGFTQEKLAADDSAQKWAQRQHAEVYLALAEEAEPHLRGDEQVAWFGRLGEESENFRAAFGYLEGDAEAALRLGAALGPFWRTRGLYREGLAYLTAFLENSDRRTRTAARALLLAGELAWGRSEHERAWGLLEESLAVSKGLGDRSLTAQALMTLGIICERNRGRPDEARARYEAALEHAEAAEDAPTKVSLLRLLGGLHLEAADYRGARAHYEASARLAARFGDHHSRAKALISLATALTYSGELGEAHALNEQCLELFRAVGDSHGEGIALLNLGMDASQRGDDEGSAERYRQSLALFKKLGDRRMVSHLLNNLAGSLEKRLDPTWAELREAEELLEESLSVQRTVGDVSLTAHALLLLGHVLCGQGRADEAGERYQTCLRLSREAGDRWALMRTLEALARWHHAEGDDGAAHTLLTEAATLARTSGDQKTLGKTLETQARLAFTAGDETRAAHLLAEAEALRERYGFQRMPKQQRDYETLRQSLRERLGERLNEVWPDRVAV